MHTTTGFNTVYNDELKNDFGSDFKSGGFKIVQFIKRMNKTGFTEPHTEPLNNESVESIKVSKPSLVSIEKRKVSQKKGTASAHKRPEVFSSSGYRLLVNPFF